MYHIICPSCGKRHRYNKPDYRDLIGKKTACKKCKISWTISVDDLAMRPPIVSEDPPEEMKSFHLSLSNPNDPPKQLKLPSFSPRFWESIKRHFAFKNMMFLGWVKGLYFFFFFLAIVITIGVFYRYAMTPDKEPLSFALVFAPWLALLWLRLIMEFGVIFFRIHEEIVELNDNIKKNVEA